MGESALTIARAAEAAAVGVETVRYYERRGLVPQPDRVSGAYRHYSRRHVDRIRFIKRAQELGFSLAEIESLLALEDGTQRSEVRRIAETRLAEIRARLADLQRMESALAHLLERCRHGGTARCPIIEALASHDASPATGLPATGAALGERAKQRKPVRGARARKRGPDGSESESLDR
jgi:MerR family mercuric resistance operon transcriptional regulator